ncbi:MAG: MFS transporter [Porticoccaceae bacterium]
MTVVQPPNAFDTVPSLFTGQFMLLLAVTSVFGLSFSTFFLLPKFLSVALAADAVTIGSVTTVFWLASALTVPYVGGRIDRHGRKRFAFLGGLILAISCAGFLWVDSVGPLIWVLRILQGVGFTLFYVAVATLATDLSPPARLGQALGIFGAVMIFTNAVGPAFAEWASEHFGWKVVFAATAVAAFLAALLSRLVAEQRQTPASGTHASLLQVLRRPGMTPVILASTMVGWVFGTLFTFYQPWALSLGIDKVAIYLVAYAVAAVSVRICFGNLADRLGRLRVVRAMLLLYVLTPLMLIWLDRFGLFAAGAMLGLTQGIYYPALNAVAIDCATPAERGKVMAAYNGAFNLGLAAAGLVLGHVVIATDYRTVFALASVISLAAFALLVMTPERGARRGATTDPG